jgi:CRP/FNR family transcriptional regulator
MENPESLEALNFFHGLEPEDRDLLAAISTRHDYEAGSVIYTEGNRSSAVRVLESGLVSLRRSRKGALDHVQLTAVSEPGAVFGIGALVGEVNLHPHSAVCLEDTSVVAIDRERLLTTLHDNPEAGVRILLRFAQYLAARLTAARDQIRHRAHRGLISHG